MNFKELPSTIPLQLPALDPNPLVSVLMGSYNYSKFIGMAIRSVQVQTYQNFEIIVCDDGSSDNSVEIVEHFAKSDPRVRVICKDNGGHASALNKAFSESKGEVVCILDADDFFCETKLRKVVDVFRINAAAGIVTHDLNIVDGGGLKRGVLKYRQSGYLGPDIPTLRQGLPMPQASGLSFRREILKEIMPIPADQFRNSADWAIAYVAAFLCITAVVPEALSSYRIHGDNLSGTTSTSKTLNTAMLVKTLDGMKRVVFFVNEYMQSNFDVQVPSDRVRNIIEHQLLLGCLQKNGDIFEPALRDLKTAFRMARSDYPAHRFLFWQIISLFPFSVSRLLIHISFKIRSKATTLLLLITNRFHND